jgi:hypothetical protein
VEGKVLIISKEQIENLINKLNDPAKFDESRDEVKKMIEIKSALLWRAAGPRSCCGSLEGIRVCLDSEVEILEEVLDALDKPDIPRASSLLRDYIKCLGLLEQ